VNEFVIYPSKIDKNYNRIKFGMLALLLMFLLGGCASPVVQVASGALQAIGLVKESPKVDTAKEITIRIFAGANMNADTKGRPFAIVLKVYKLRNDSGFISTPYEVLASGATEKQALGTDLLDSRELVLTPGQQLEFKEKLAPDVGYLGIAAFFRAPTAERWRYSFATSEPLPGGLSLGVHACALTVSQGVTHAASGGDPRSLNGVSCASSR
jgi:type VI secretion system protein VasD